MCESNTSLPDLNNVDTKLYTTVKVKNDDRYFWYNEEMVTPYGAVYRYYNNEILSLSVILCSELQLWLFKLLDQGIQLFFIENNPNGGIIFNEASGDFFHLKNNFTRINSWSDYTPNLLKAKKFQEADLIDMYNSMLFEVLIIVPMLDNDNRYFFNVIAGVTSLNTEKFKDFFKKSFKTIKINKIHPLNKLNLSISFINKMLLIFDEKTFNENYFFYECQKPFLFKKWDLYRSNPIYLELKKLRDDSRESNLHEERKRSEFLHKQFSSVTHFLKNQDIEFLNRCSLLIRHIYIFNYTTEPSVYRNSQGTLLVDFDYKEDWLNFKENFVLSQLVEDVYTIPVICLNFYNSSIIYDKWDLFSMSEFFVFHCSFLSKNKIMRGYPNLLIGNKY